MRGGELGVARLPGTTDRNPYQRMLYEHLRAEGVQLVGEGTPAPGGIGVSMVRTLSRQDFGARAPRIGANGAIRPRT